MILKVKPYKKPDFLRLFNYMMDKEEKLLNEDGKAFLLTHNVKGKRIEQWVQEFKKNEEHRLHKRKNQNHLTHDIISFHTYEHVSLEQMEEITREYISQRNPNGMFIAVGHFDKHPHIHIATSSIEFRTGRTMRMSKAQFQKLKESMQQYQQEKYPELSKSIINYKTKKGSIKDKEFQIKLRTGRETQKEQLIGILKTCYKKANNKETFFQLMEDCGLKVYSRGGKISGVHFANKKFRLKRIGFTEERLDELDKSLYRGRELKETRGRKGKNIERNI
jgi:Relaxase/Mobilisation nuclease domain